MATNNKQMEMTEIHSAIWRIADDLRGAVDGYSFKSYVLGTIFYKYLSEHLRDEINNHEEGNLDYASKDDAYILSMPHFKQVCVDTYGYFMLPSQLFENVIKNARNNDNLNIDLANIFSSIEESTIGNRGSEKAFKGLFADFDTNNPQLGETVAEKNKTLVALLEGINSMKLGNYKDNSVDAFGDAYEFLMGMYASNAGKSGGEFYTPQEVSELLVRLAVNEKKEINKIYDPTCGSGSLLLKAIKILNLEDVKIGFFGQEKNLTTKNLATINMFLHGIPYEKFDIQSGDTLINPKHWDDQPFDVIVSNPPYSVKWEGDSNPTLINDERFSPAGVLAPKSKADFAFIMHCLAWLSDVGSAAIVCFPGILYRSGAEKKIRKYLVDNNYIDAIIQLPENLFYGTSISTCIMVLKKGKKTNDILFINAEKEYEKITNSNMLKKENIEQIFNWFKDRKEVQYRAKIASIDEISEKDYNLSVNSYVEKEDTKPPIDIKKVNAELKEIVKKQEELRKEIDKIIEELDEDYE